LHGYSPELNLEAIRKDPPGLQPITAPTASFLNGSPSSDDRHEPVSRLAYYRAQQRGFAPGHEWEDWFAAESEVTESMLAQCVLKERQRTKCNPTWCIPFR
jgi:hypothetical protein